MRIMKKWPKCSKDLGQALYLPYSLQVRVQCLTIICHIDVLAANILQIVFVGVAQKQGQLSYRLAGAKPLTPDVFQKYTKLSKM